MATPTTRAFLYCWTDKITNKIYVGRHKGSPDDGYVSSSRLLNSEYNARPNDFTREIIAIGEYDDICKLEVAVLTAANAAKNKDFYNQTNGTAKFYCKRHTLNTREQMSRTWKSKGKFNCNKEKALAAWTGSKHKESSKQLMSIAGQKHSKTRSNNMKLNNPMKSPEVIAKMLATRKLNRELRNG